MNRRLATFAFSSLLLPISALAADTFDTEQAATSVDNAVRDWRRDIHAHPELGNREFRTAELVAAHLRAIGLEDVKTRVAHTGVTGILRGARPGRRLALRADMDALPVTEETGLPFASTVTTEYRGQQTGVMHACGHDTHTAILMGVAQALAAHRDELAGEILFVFQPAEEGAPEGEEGGAPLMLKEGLFADFKPEAIFGLHVHASLNAGEIGYRSGPFMAAADFFSITVHGRQTHGSRPWNGVDPVAISAELIGSAQQIVSRELNISRLPVVVSFGAINGGIRHNIIPDDVQMIGTIRSFDEDMRTDVHARLKRIAEHTAAAHGATVSYEIPLPGANPVTVNDPKLMQEMLPALEASVAPGKLKAIDRTMGGEDFSHYALEVPGLFIFVGSTPPDIDPKNAPSNHSPKFFVDEDALKVGVRAMINLTQRFLTVPAAES
ncbi:MAG: amidohydrolase [Lysobacteraceae bacterium]